MTQRPQPYEHLVSDRVFDGLDALAEEARRRGTSTAALAHAWVLAHPHVTGVVCGPSRVEHLEPALAALELEISDDDRRRLATVFET